METRSKIQKLVNYLNFQSIQKIATYFNGRLVITSDYIETDNCMVSRERVAEFKKWLDQ